MKFTVLLISLILIGSLFAGQKTHVVTKPDTLVVIKADTTKIIKQICRFDTTFGAIKIDTSKSVVIDSFKVITTTKDTSMVVKQDTIKSSSKPVKLVKPVLAPAKK